jgi:hypothetical protein
MDQRLCQINFQCNLNAFVNCESELPLTSAVTLSNKHFTDFQSPSHFPVGQRLEGEIDNCYNFVRLFAISDVVVIRLM